MALQGNFAGPILFLVVFNVFQFAIRYWLMNWSYKMGESAIDMLTANAREFTRAASILGVIVVGALVSVYGSTEIALKVDNGTTQAPVPIQTIVDNAELPDYASYLYVDGNKDKMADGAAVKDLGNGKSQISFTTYEEQPVQIDIQKVLDGIIPDLVPLAITLLLYWLLAKKKWTPIYCIMLLLAMGVVGSYIGLF